VKLAISQNCEADDYFEVLKLSKSQLDQKLQRKTQFWKKKSIRKDTLTTALKFKIKF
jgi:hypothetical protein